MSKTCRALYDDACQALREAGVPDPAFDAKRLMEFACGLTFHDLYAHGERVPNDSSQSLLNECVKKRASRIPLAYITGTQGFMGLDFFVSADVLVPRPDTETLAEAAMKHLFDGMRLLDLCTGSGCVGLALLRYSNDTTAVLCDLSPAAVDCAGENAKRLKLTERVTLAVCDLFPRRSLIPEGGFDLITANPPYIKTDVIDTLEDEVRFHEPRMALDGGADGLVFYRRIVAEAERYLTRGGRLLLETGYDEALAVASLMRENGYGHIDIIRDAGGNERVVTGVMIPRATNGDLS
ncbi:MAG: peptide chain release factor N(5)-glutamine methyltransferase [Lachnospiraceae bacterium]|nr:peptide chain release factor N(5)-glutamine methyltransferase [Lachnospiraceae bacterium]